MKSKIKSIFLACTMTVSCLPFSWTSANAATPDYSLWDKFIKYDLCITDYDSLTNEEKDLCRFIFVTEQSSDKPIRCERARRILAHDGNIGERITLEQLDAAYGICDRYSGTKKGMYMKNISYSYTHCVADIIGLDGWYGYNEYWLDDKGSVKVTEYYNEDKFNITSSLTNEETEKFFSEHSSIIHDTTGEAYINKKSIDTIKYIKYEDNTYYITYDNKAILYKNHYYDYNDKYKDAEAISEPCIIPSEVNGYPLIGIDSREINDSEYVEIDLHDTIELIRSNAFGYCKQLKKINFPNKLKCIEVDAFKNCAFEDLNINAPDLNIQPYAFECCKDLTQIKLNVKTVGENAFFVPMPKDPEADEYYVPTGMDAFVMVKGGQNPEGVAKYLDCKRYTLLNDKVRSIADEQMVEDYGWSQDMIDMKDSMQSLAEENPVYDFSKGVSADCGEILDINLRNCARGLWACNVTYDSIFSAVEQIIKEVNDGSSSDK